VYFLSSPIITKRFGGVDGGGLAERGFFRALKELRQLQKPVRAVDPQVQVEAFRRELGSFLSLSAMDEEFDAMDPDDFLPTPSGPSKPLAPALSPTLGGVVAVPFAIGRPR